jgi:formylglycine-generating enzyme required for sulfatase activity
MFPGAKNPVEQVSWEDCQAFIKKLNDLVSGGGFRLPTEAEWEYACRAGTETAYSNGDSESGLGEVAWYDGNSGKTMHPVGQKKPNAWGLYNMHGNVREWCADDKREYTSGPATDPSGPSSGSARVLRGGSWRNNAVDCRSANRAGRTPSDRACNLGFRLARDGK